MERISIPFTAGAAISALLSEAYGHSYSAGIAISALALAFIIITATVRKEAQHGFIYAASFFAAGIFCHATSTLSGNMAGGEGNLITSLAADTCDTLRSAIDSLDIGDHVRNEMLKALLTGDRNGLPEEVTSTFRAAGASHILALSGLHIGIIYTLLAGLLSFLGNSIPAMRLRSLILVLAAAFYTIMTGASPSMVRAFLFILLSELCRNLPGRVRDPARILQTALVIQLAVSPAVIGSLGFQLSYLAVSGIVWIMPKISSWFPDDGTFNPMKKIWDLCALSISCQCLTAPLVWLRFRTFPKFFLVTNLAAMPLTTLSIATAVFCLVTGTHCPGIALKACGQCVNMLLYVLEVLASLS